MPYSLTVFVPSTKLGCLPNPKSFFPENTSYISLPLNTAIFGLYFRNFSNRMWLPVKRSRNQVWKVSSVDDQRTNGYLRVLEISFNFTGFWFVESLEKCRHSRDRENFNGFGWQHWYRVPPVFSRRRSRKVSSKSTSIDSSIISPVIVVNFFFQHIDETKRRSFFIGYKLISENDNSSVFVYRPIDRESNLVVREIFHHWQVSKGGK